MTSAPSSATANFGTSSVPAGTGHGKTLRRAAVLAALLTAPIVFTAVWFWTGLVPFPWDAAWYRSVAGGGYHFDGDILRQQNVAFLPGYPIAVFIYHLVTGLDWVWCQYIASTTAYVVGSLCFYQAFRKWFSPERSALIVLVVSINPFAIYLFNGYSEAMFYMLCGVFFLGIAGDRLWISSIALSFALITRPHAVSLYPVLIYALAKTQGLLSEARSGSRIDRSRTWPFLRSTVDCTFLVLVFPAALTIYWYLRFSDPLVYLNALAAWNGVGTSGVSGQLRFLLHHLTHFHTVPSGTIAGVPVVVASPGNVATVNVVLNVLGLVFLIRQRKFEIALFCGGLLAFWFLKSVPGDSGRHALLMLGAPVLLASALWTPGMVQGSSRSAATTPASAGRSVIRAVLAGFLLLSFLHFAAYALLQLRGGWIS